MPSPKVNETSFPASKAPKSTITPNIPGIMVRFITLAPYAAEKAGAVPLPPILIARNMESKKGMVKAFNNSDILFRFLSEFYEINEVKVEFYI